MTKIGITKYQDKVLHFLGGLVITLSLISFISIWAFIVTAIVAVGKEYHDIKTTDFDYYDIASTLFGGWIGLVIWELL